MTAAIVVYVLAAIPAFLMAEGVFSAGRALLVAALWPLWPVVFGAHELSMWIDTYRWQREEKKRAARGGK